MDKNDKTKASFTQKVVRLIAINEEMEALEAERKELQEHLKLLLELHGESLEPNP